MSAQERIAEVLLAHRQIGERALSGCECGWLPPRRHRAVAYANHQAEVIANLPDIAIIEIPTDITPDPEDHTWFKVRGYEYYGGTDEDMPVDQVEAQAADSLAIARYRRDVAARVTGGES